MSTRGQESIWRRLDSANDSAQPNESPTVPSPASNDRPSRLMHLAEAVAGALGKNRKKESARSGAAVLKARMVAVLGCACEACRTPMPSASLIHLHHVIPVSRGGETVWSNALLSCPNCHAKAHWLDRHLSDETRPTTRTELITALTKIAHL